MTDPDDPARYIDLIGAEIARRKNWRNSKQRAARHKRRYAHYEHQHTPWRDRPRNYRY